MKEAATGYNSHVCLAASFNWLSGIGGLDYWTGILDWPKLL